MLFLFRFRDHVGCFFDFYVFIEWAFVSRLLFKEWLLGYRVVGLTLRTPELFLGILPKT